MNTSDARAFLYSSSIHVYFITFFFSGRLALPGFTAYSASKYGLIGFSDSLRREMRKFGVKVISIEPKLYR
jgi:NAD(P)-dependent dehydrogenase (short-subunit alcohol dehydrogenase family)